MYVDVTVSQCREKYELFCGKYPPNFGKAISRRERDEKELFEKNYVYSEISFDALGGLLVCSTPQIV